MFRSQTCQALDQTVIEIFDDVDVRLRNATMSSVHNLELRRKNMDLYETHERTDNVYDRKKIFGIDSINADCEV